MPRSVRRMADKVMVFGMKLELHKNLSPDEFRHIKDSLNLWHFVELNIMKRTLLCSEIPMGQGHSEIWIVKEGRDAYISYPQGFEKDLSRYR